MADEEGQGRREADLQQTSGRFGFGQQALFNEKVEHDEKASSRDSFSLGIEKLTRMADPPPSLFSPRSPRDRGVDSPRSQASFLSGAATARRSSPDRFHSPNSRIVEYTAANSPTQRTISPFGATNNIPADGLSPVARETIAVPRLKLPPSPDWEQQPSTPPPPPSSSSSSSSSSSQQPPQPLDASTPLAPFDSTRRPAPLGALGVLPSSNTLDCSTVATPRSKHSPLRVGEDGTRHHELRPHSAAIFPPYASPTPSSLPPRTHGRPVFSMHAPPAPRKRSRPRPQFFVTPAPSRELSRSQSMFAATHPFYPSHDVIAGADRSTRIMVKQACVDRRAQAPTYGARGFVFRDQADEPEDGTQRLFFGKGGPDTLYWKQVVARKPSPGEIETRDDVKRSGERKPLPMRLRPKTAGHGTVEGRWLPARQVASDGRTMEEIGSGWRAGALISARQPGAAFLPLRRSLQVHDHRGLPDPEGDDKRLREHASRSAAFGRDFRLKTYKQPSLAHARYTVGLQQHHLAKRPEAKGQGWLSHR